MSDRCWRTTRRSPKPFGAPNTAGTSDSESQDWHGRENEVRHKRATPRKMRARRPAVASGIVIGVPSGRLAVAVSPVARSFGSAIARCGRGTLKGVESWIFAGAHEKRDVTRLALKPRARR